ncbi:MAG: hypothetical protein JWL62_1947 [Hyphomicrobiales bacterium]|nr:hypothetical protein [Hyphomicrobiales bacterium]
MQPFLSQTRFFLTPAFDEGRARLYCLLLGLWPWFDLAVLIVMGWGEIDIAKQPPFGRDFISFYAASTLVLADHAADVYVVAAHKAAEHRIFSEGDYSAFFYPPLFLLICAPLAKLPFFVALAAWLGTSMTACIAVLRKLAPPSLGWLPLLAFPGVYMNIVHGQNAFLTTALFGAALLVLDRRPALAGLLFGALAFKPHFGLLIPIFLLASGRWQAFAASACTVLLLCLVSLVAFGAETWRGFLEITSFSREVLEQNRVGYEKMQSVFAMVRLLGGSVAAAYGAQALVAAAVIITLVRASRLKHPAQAVGALLVTGTLLATPFLLRYDLMLLAIPLVWLAREGVSGGLCKGEICIGIAVFALPLVPIEIAETSHMLIAPLVIGALFIVLARLCFSRWEKLSAEPADEGLHSLS